MGNAWKLLVVAAIALGVAACGGGGTGSNEMRVAFIPQLTGIPYFTAMEKGGDRAAKDLGVEFRYTGPTQTDAPEQVRIMESLTRQRFDAVSVSVLDPASISPAIAKAREQGV